MDYLAEAVPRIFKSALAGLRSDCRGGRLWRCAMLAATPA